MCKTIMHTSVIGTQLVFTDSDIPTDRDSAIEKYVCSHVMAMVAY